MTAAPKNGSLPKLLCRDNLACRTRFLWGEADVSWEEVGKCTSWARRGMGPSAYARIVEIMSGRAISQQGLATTCKDPPTNGKPRRREGHGLAHEPV